MMMNAKYVTALLLALNSCAYAMETTSVVKTPDWNAEKYAKDSSPQFLAAMKVLSHIKFKETDNVLDIGCGNGKVTWEVAKRVPSGTVIGIDPSVSMISYATNHYTDLSNLYFEQANIAHYSSEHKFNYALSFASFAWVKEQQEALMNIANALQPSGRFVAGIADEDSPYLRARYDIMKDDKWASYFAHYEIPYYPLNENKIRELCKNAGLTPIVVDKRTSPYSFANREGFIKFMRAIPVQIDKIPEDRQEEFLNDIITKYIVDVPEKEDGTIELILSGIFVVAQK